MVDIGKGILSGVVATTVLCSALYLLSLAGILARPDPVHVLNGVSLWPPVLSWIAQFALGAFVWGTLFAFLSSILPGPYSLKGLIFGVVVWFLALGVAWLVPAATLPIGAMTAALHVLFGGVLGLTYGSLLE